MKSALIIFVRNPELGKVKTRLAKQIGDAQALQVYKELLQHTHDVTREIACDKFVYYTDYIAKQDLWDNGVFKKKLQQGETLGDRMLIAFSELFEQGYTKIVIIGSDCPELSGLIIEDAFNRLSEAAVVIGPSSDGGYYLLGLVHLIPDFFMDKPWSTDKVLSATLQEAARLGTKCNILPVLSDIDTETDLKFYQDISRNRK